MAGVHRVQGQSGEHRVFLGQENYGDISLLKNSGHEAVIFQERVDMESGPCSCSTRGNITDASKETEYDDHTSDHTSGVKT